MLTDETDQNVDDMRRADATSHVDRNAFSGELVDDREALETLSVGALIEDEIVIPSVIHSDLPPIALPASGWQSPRLQG